MDTPVMIEDTYAEAFPMYATRVLITAFNKKWVLTAAREATGFATSIIMSPAEAGIEGLISSRYTPDGRVGAYIQIYHRDLVSLKMQVLTRIGQCILTCPTTAVFDGLPNVKRKISVGRAIARFGDGFEYEGELYGRRVWRIPVMEGEFIIEDKIGVVKGVAGGNILILARDLNSGLNAAENVVKAIRRYCRFVITPFPGGIVRSGSKVGSLKYRKLGASTNHPYCPLLRDKIKDSKLPPDVNCVYEIVINGLSEKYVKLAMGIAIKVASKSPGVVKIDAANFGGRLGKYCIKLYDALDEVEKLGIKL